MNRKILASVMSLSLLGSVAGPTAIFASEPITQEQQDDNKSTTLKSEVFASIPEMSKYILAGEDGLLHLDAESIGNISPEVYKVFEDGVQKTNSLIKQDILELDSDGNVVPINYTPPINESKISLQAFGNLYPWGYALTLTDRESRNLAYAMNTAGSAAAAFTAIMGLIPTPPTKVAQAISQIINFAHIAIAGQISYNNEGRGVTINFHFALYYTINPN
ncbi:hypothetical protein [Paenibacillus massiliensis]|uniref:hypothetical protein n=1 Tax=Paenibacillus massiliensis TaxID=225917 RepID=UPI000377CA13|nr:hypothetical protein [Paenibacillus massiliensis]